MKRSVLGAVLFDLDDTLHDDTGVQLRGAGRVAADLARSHPGVTAERIVTSYVAQSDAFWKALGSTSLGAPLSDVRARMWGRALADVGIDDDGTLARRSGESYNAYRRELFAVFPETLALLGTLRDRGLKLGMITNGLAETHREKIALLRLEAHFDLVFIADEVGLMKPDERIFRLACDRLALPPERCAMVGDRYDRDIRPALDLGMVTVWTNVRNEAVPPGDPSPDADVPTLAGVAAALAPYLPRPGT